MNLQSTKKHIWRFYIFPIIITAIALWFYSEYCCPPSYWWLLILIILFIGHYFFFLRKRSGADSADSQSQTESEHS